MSIWKNIQDKAVLDRLGEEAIYEAALEEFETGERRRGLWAKAIVQAEGDQVRTEAVYLKLLVAALKDELYIASRATEIAGNRISSQAAKADLTAPAKIAAIERPIPRRRVHPDPKIDRLLALCHRLRTDSLAFDQYQILAAAIGASLAQEGFFGGAYVIRHQQAVSKFNNLPALRPWFMKHVLPVIEAMH